MSPNPARNGKLDDIKFRKQAVARIRALRRQAWSSSATTNDLLRYIAALLEVCAYAAIKEELRK